MSRSLLFGFHAIQVRLKTAPDTIREIHFDPTRRDGRMRQFLDRAREAGRNLVESDAKRIDKLVGNPRHQGVMAFVSPLPVTHSIDDHLDGVEGPPLLLLLDGVTDPRNLGACLRVADGAGVHAVVAPKDHACPLTEAAIQTASGAAESVPYVMVTNLAGTISDLRERGVWVMGTADEADGTLYDHSIPSAVAWVLGAEGKSLRHLTRQRCDTLVRIPMASQVPSLNVSVAAGIVLYETVRQRMVAAAAR